MLVIKLNKPKLLDLIQINQFIINLFSFIKIFLKKIVILYVTIEGVCLERKYHLWDA